MRSSHCHALALAAALAAVVLVSAAWIVHLRLGLPLRTFAGGPMVLAAPLGILILTGAWLILRALAPQLAALSVINMLVFCAAAAYLVVAITCGPIACFQPGPNRSLGWFVIAGVALAAFVHHVVLTRLRGDGDADRRASR